MRVVPDCAVHRFPGNRLSHVRTDGDEKGETVNRPELPDEIALMLNTSARDVRSASIQDLELVCRARGSSLLVVVRCAESALQRCQENRDRNVQSPGHDDQVLDGPTGPPP